MKYVSIDLETTGLDRKRDQVIMVAMIVEDTENKLPREELPTFACLVRHGVEGAPQRYEGSPFALWLNAWIFEALAKNDESKYPIYSSAEWETHARNFLEANFVGQKVVAAGKNVAGFDIQFLGEKITDKIFHRTIDPGSVFIDWKADKPDSLGDIKKKLDIEGEVTHDAVDDAWDVIEVLRTQY